MNKAESKYFNTAVKFDEALLLLLKKKPLDYITVSELCEEAGVNRSTFYLHYENIGDLLEETIRYVLDKFLSYFPVEEQAVTHRFNDAAITELNFVDAKYLYPYLSFIKENRHVFSTVLSRPVTFRFEQLFEKLFDNVFNPILDRFHYPQDERKYVMMFYLNGLTAIIVQWLKDGCCKSISDVSEIIHYCVFGREDKWNISSPRA